jgi:hypothetical protein
VGEEMENYLGGHGDSGTHRFLNCTVVGFPDREDRMKGKLMAKEVEWI